LPVHARHGHTKVWLAALALLVVAVLAAGGYELWQTQSERNQLPTTALPPPVTAPAAAPILPAPAPTEPPSTGMPEHAADSVAALSPDVTSNSAPGGGVAPNAAIADTHASPSQGSSRSAHITIAFERESWIEIRDNAGKLVYSGTGQANTVRSFEAAVPLEVTVGNASGVRITYNGKPFDVAAHATRNIARFTLE